MERGGVGVDQEGMYWVLVWDMVSEDKVSVLLKMCVHQENMRVVFGRLWGLCKDLKPSKT